MFVLHYANVENQIKMSFRQSDTDRSKPFTLSDEGNSFYVGIAPNIPDEKIFNSDWEHQPNILNEMHTAMYIVTYDATGCSFASDASGRELLFYYYSDEDFIISDSFWEITKIIKPTYQDISKEIVEEMLCMGGGVPCDHATPVRNLFWLGANFYCHFNSSTWELSINRFSGIQRTVEISNIEDAISGMDKALQDMAEYLYCRHPNAIFGLGLSGGLDSRVALYYLQKAGLRLKCFNTCTRRPHKILLANSVKNARMLAKKAQVDYVEVEWSPVSLRKKIDLMLKNQPFGTGGHYTNLYKYESLGMPEFDVLLSAGQGIGPMLVGVSAFAGSDKMSREDIISYLYHLAIGEVRAYSFTENSLRKQFDIWFPNKIDILQGRYFDIWNQMAPKEAYERINNKIIAYVDRCLNEGYRPADVTLDYRTNALGPNGRNGAYESRFNTVQAYTIYTPFLMQEALKWDINLIEDRRILKELIRRYIPQFSDIGEEAYGSTRAKQSKTSLLFQKIVFSLRGSGIMADEWYANNPLVKKEFMIDMNNESTWFRSMFPASENVELIWRMSPARKNSIWDVKRLIDCIEQGTYMNF